MTEELRHIEPIYLTIDNIKEGVGGFSVDPMTIPDPSLRGVVVPIHAYIEERGKDLYTIEEIVGNFGESIGESDHLATSNRLKTPSTNRLIHYRHTGGKRKQLGLEPIEMLAAVTYLKVRNDLANDSPTHKVPFPTVSSQSKEALGSYYAVVPFKSINRLSKEIPRYLVSNKPFQDFNPAKDQSPPPLRFMMNGKELLLSPDLPKDEKVAILLKHVDKPWLEEKLIALDRESVRDPFVKIGTEVPWQRAGIDPDLGKSIFFMCTGRGSLDGFELIITTPHMKKVLKRAIELMDQNQNISYLYPIYKYIEKQIEVRKQQFKG